MVWVVWWLWVGVFDRIFMNLCFCHGQTWQLSISVLAWVAIKPKGLFGGKYFVWFSLCYEMELESQLMYGTCFVLVQAMFC